MSSSLTSYHAQYFAYELTRSRAADDQSKFTASLQDATVDLNPHQFARSKESYLRHIQWYLVIIDEAHRLRNVYRPDNKIGKSIKRSLAHTQKVLLNATPLQNSLLELYGLVSIIDDYTFGDLKSFKSNYARIGDGEQFADLKERLKPVCKRTLRRQVLEYINFTNRLAIVEESIRTRRSRNSMTMSPTTCEATNSMHYR